MAERQQAILLFSLTTYTFTLYVHLRPFIYLAPLPAPQYSAPVVLLVLS